MDPKTIRPLAHDIQKRFFEALDMAIQSNKIAGLKTFCNDHGLHRPKYSNIRTAIKEADKKGTGYKFIDIDALAYLVADFGVSADWLLLGKGGMFKSKKGGS